MWMPSYIALAVAVTAIVLQIVLKNKNIIKEDSKAFRLIDIFGITIPMMVFVGNYSYVITDTTREVFIVGTGLNVCLALLYLFSSAWNKKKYNFIAFLVITFLILFIVNRITPYMLATMEKGLYGGIIGSFIGSSLRDNKYKVRLLITGLIVLFTVLSLPLNSIDGFKTVNKVERTAVEFAESRGYAITDEDTIIFLSRAERNHPVSLTILKIRESEPVSQVDRELDTTYYRGEITELKRVK